MAAPGCAALSAGADRPPSRLLLEWRLWVENRLSRDGLGGMVVRRCFKAGLGPNLTVGP